MRRTLTALLILVVAAVFNLLTTPEAEAKKPPKLHTWKVIHTTSYTPNYRGARLSQCLLIKPVTDPRAPALICRSYFNLTIMPFHGVDRFEDLQGITFKAPFAKMEDAEQAWRHHFQHAQAEMQRLAAARDAGKPKLHQWHVQGIRHVGLNQFEVTIAGPMERTGLLAPVYRATRTEPQVEVLLAYFNRMFNGDLRVITFKVETPYKDGSQKALEALEKMAHARWDLLEKIATELVLRSRAARLNRSERKLLGQMMADPTVQLGFYIRPVNGERRNLAYATYNHQPLRAFGEEQLYHLGQVTASYCSDKLKANQRCYMAMVESGRGIVFSLGSEGVVFHK